MYPTSGNSVARYRHQPASTSNRLEPSAPTSATASGDSTSAVPGTNDDDPAPWRSQRRRQDQLGGGRCVNGMVFNCGDIHLVVVVGAGLKARAFPPPV
jgi:hypothetical protein